MQDHKEHFQTEEWRTNEKIDEQTKIDQEEEKKIYLEISRGFPVDLTQFRKEILLHNFGQTKVFPNRPELQKRKRTHRHTHALTHTLTAKIITQTNNK